MRYFELSDAALKKQIRGGERIAGYSVLVVGGLSYLSFFSFVTFSWAWFVAGLAILWLVVEVVAYVARRQRYIYWSAYRIGYENHRLVEEREKLQTAEIMREHVETIEETRFGLLIISSENLIIIPYELTGFNEILVRLRNWGFVEDRSTRWRREIKNFIRLWFRKFELEGNGSADIFHRSYRKRRLSPYRREIRWRRIEEKIEPYFEWCDRNMNGGAMFIAFGSTFVGGFINTETGLELYALGLGGTAISIWAAFFAVSYWKILTSWSSDGYIPMLFISGVAVFINFLLLTITISNIIENAF